MLVLPIKQGSKLSKLAAFLHRYKEDTMELRTDPEFESKIPPLLMRNFNSLRQTSWQTAWLSVPSSSGMALL